MRPAPAIVPEVSRLAAPAAADAPLAPAEIAEMHEHLAFLRRYKEALRLKLNAGEDLLVNGQREPTDRGVCRHLIGKVDRTVIEHAVEREPFRSDPAARARMLAGAIRLTADVGVLLAYLETLPRARSQAEAAQGFSEVVHRIEFESLSATRVARLLQVLIETFADHERVQVLFSLLAGPGFRRAFDAAAAAFPPEVATVCAPLRAVHRRLVGEGGPADPALLAAGMEQVLSAPDPVLRGYEEGIRTGMLELALDPRVPPALADRAAGALLPSLLRGGRPYARLALRRAGQLLARHADDRARALLEELRRAEPGTRTAERWLAALDARRLGRVALGGEVARAGGLAEAFWLDGQHPVWLRTATAGEGERLRAEARLQRALPGVASVVEDGVAAGSAYVAVAGPGRPLEPATAALGVSGGLFLAAAAARVLRGLALAGVVLPDAAPARFLHAGGALTLADLDGACATAPADAEHAHAGLAAAFARAVVPDGAGERLVPQVGDALARALAEPGDLVTFIDTLDRAALRAPRG